MSTIKYTHKCEPYETGGRFSRIKDTREASLEFDITDLPKDQQQLFRSVAIGNRYELSTYILDDGREPNPQGLSDRYGLDARLKTQNYIADSELTLEQALDHMSQQAQHKANLQKQVDKINSRRKIIKDEMKKQEAEAKERADQKRAEEVAKAQAEAPLFDWSDANTAIVNLYDKIHTVSGIEQDSRHNGNWIKTITGIDRAQKGGYMFQGDWVRNQTDEISNQNTVYLIAGTSGSRRHQTTTYQVVILRDGKLEKTDIATTDSNGGWALTIRDRVAKLLVELNSGTIKDEFETLREAAALDTEMVAVDRKLLAKLLARVS